MNGNHIETDLQKIKHLSSIRENENINFRIFLKSMDERRVDNIVHLLHKEITEQIDCTMCGNCCCQLKPELHKKDIAILAQIENITLENFKDKYCEKNEFGEIYLKTIPCYYLEGKKCRIYENRPEECRNFPNTHKKEFISRSLGMINNYEICPIVFNLMERLKDELRFRR
jgi:Fe-S-cluster containining protein